MSYVPQKNLRRAVILFAGLFVLSLVLLFDGCAARVAHVTDLPAGVTEAQAKNYDAAVADLHKIADLNSAARQAIIAVRGSGAFPNDAEYAKAITAIGHIAQYEIEAVQFLQQQPKSFGAPQQQKLKSELSLISDELATLNSIGSLPGIKSAGTQSTVGQIIAEITGTANLILGLQL
jgi:hypothetical protein